MNKKEEKHTTRKLSTIVQERYNKEEYESFNINFCENLTDLQKNLFFNDIGKLISTIQQKLACLKALQNSFINCTEIDYNKLNQDLVDFSNLLTNHVENCLQKISKEKEERYEDSSNG